MYFYCYIIQNITILYHGVLHSPVGYYSPITNNCTRTLDYVELKFNI